MAISTLALLAAGMSVANPDFQTPSTPVLATQGLPADEPSVEQIKSLEQQVHLVLTEARRQQALLSQMREQLAAAESGAAWLPWLGLALAAMGLMAMRWAFPVRRLERELELRPPAAVVERDQASHTADRPKMPDAGGPSTGRNQNKAGVASDKVIGAAAGAAAGAALRPVRDVAAGTGALPRPMSVEELLDLDQQVDFFVALGQEQSAVDLLLGHVRATGGTNALPHVKLLEVYRLQGDDEAYERTRERFNQRFNAVVPEAMGDLMTGRTLEDYPDVVLRLQHAWSHPIRAAAELESLLLRRADLEPFDLPAYREILMLHALVRDLPAGSQQTAERAVQPTARLDGRSPAAPQQRDDGVDLVLPLGGDRPVASLPAASSAGGAVQAKLAEWVFGRDAAMSGTAMEDAAAWPSSAKDRPDAPAPLDLDLSESAPAPREFTQPAAFTAIDRLRDDPQADFGALDDEDSLPRPRP